MRETLRGLALLAYLVFFSPGGGPVAPAHTAPSRLNLPVNTWVVRKVPKSSNTIWNASKHIRLTYDSDRHLVYLWGGDYCVSYGGGDNCRASREEFWSYDVVKDQWQLLLDQAAADAPGLPRGRCKPGMAYDSRRKLVWMTTGQERHDHYHANLGSGGLWAFDPARHTWWRAGPAPDEESAHVRVSQTEVEYMAYDPHSDALFAPARSDTGWEWMFLEFPLAGVAFGQGAAHDNWRGRRIPAQDNTMGALSFAVDTRRNRAILYLPDKGETWSYDFAQKRAERLARQPLPPKCVFGMLYDARNDKVVLFGGYSDYEGLPTAKPLNDLWVFDFASKRWTKPALAGSFPPPRKGETIVYDSYNDVIVQFGGTGGWQDSVDQYGYDGNEIFLLRLDFGAAAGAASAVAPEKSPSLE